MVLGRVTADIVLQQRQMLLLSTRLCLIWA
jgi:hypothetical protein